MPLVKTLEENTRGRDFVIGDLHGCFGLLQQAMDVAKFDTAADRIISLSDLIDRGPESVRCARLVNEPWFEAIRANHEDTLIYLCATGKFDEQKCKTLKDKFGSGWMLKTDPDILLELAESFRKLPVAIELKTPCGTVGFVHADVPVSMSWPVFAAKIEARDSDTIDTALWGRDRIYNNDDSDVAGINRVFVGHTVQTFGLKQFGNVFAIDTGAYRHVLQYSREHWLTMVEVTAPEDVLLRPIRLLPVGVDVRTANPQPA